MLTLQLHLSSLVVHTCTTTKVLCVYRFVNSGFDNYCYLQPKFSQANPFILVLTGLALLIRFLACYCMLGLIMPRCACASKVYGSVFVCLSVFVCRLLQLLKDQ